MLAEKRGVTPNIHSSRHGDLPNIREARMHGLKVSEAQRDWDMAKRLIVAA